MNGAHPKPRRPWLDFGLAWTCVFVGLSLPFPKLPELYVRQHALLAAQLLPRVFESGVSLALQPNASGSASWVLTLLVEPPGVHPAVSLPIDLRGLVYLPTACYVALAVATPFASWRSNAKLLMLGLVALEPLLLAIVALPVVSFLGGTGPVRAFELGVGTHTVLQLVYRALLASPSMAYVIPLGMWWGLLQVLCFPKSEGLPPNFVV